MDKPVVWLPRNPCPPVPFNVQARINELRSHLDPNSPLYECPEQHENIKAAITLYEQGKINGVDRVFIRRGKLIQWKDISKDPAWTWVEGMSHQLIQKCAYGHGDFGENYHEVSINLFHYL